MKLPGSAGIFPVGFGIPQMATGTADDFWFPVARDIGKAGRFVVEDVENDVALPVTFAALWIFVPSDFLAGKAIDDDVRPTILIKVIGEEEKAVGIGIVHAEAPFETGDGFFGAVRFFMFEGGV